MERLRTYGISSSTWRLLMYGAVAQLGEHLVCTEKVAGSIPVSSTKVDHVSMRVVSQLGELSSALQSLVRVLCNPRNVSVPEWLRGWIANPVAVSSNLTRHSIDKTS